MKQKNTKTKQIHPSENLINRIMEDGGFCFVREDNIVRPVIVNKVSLGDMLSSIVAFICMEARCPEQIDGAKRLAAELFKFGKKRKIYLAKEAKKAANV